MTTRQAPGAGAGTPGRERNSARPGPDTVAGWVLDKNLLGEVRYRTGVPATAPAAASAVVTEPAEPVNDNDDAR